MPDDTTNLFLCSWGDIQLFASQIEWEDGETQVVHNLSAGDDHPVQPRGSQTKIASLQLLFDDFEGAAETGVEAFRRFKATVKERRIFTHPASGSYFARIGSFKPVLDDSSVMRATCEIIPDGIVQSVSPAGAGTSGTSGELSVAAAADAMSTTNAAIGIGFPPERIAKLDFSKPIDVSVEASFSANVSVSASASANVSASATASATASASASAVATAQAQASAFGFARVYTAALAAAEVSGVVEVSGMGGSAPFAFALAAAALDFDARASVASWTDEEETSTRKIGIDAARISESIANMIEIGELENDLALFPAFRSAIMLGEAVRSASIAATSETPTVFVMRVTRPIALLALAAKIYGGFEAQSRARQIAQLNDISTAGWLDPGDYLMPQKPPTAAQLGGE